MAWLWFILFLLSLALNIALIRFSPANFLMMLLGMFAKITGQKICLLLVATGCILATGCDDRPKVVRALPVAAAEQPPMNPPVELRQRNWRGSKGEGSCVHASWVTVLRWCNQFTLGERWRATYENGEWDEELRRRLDAANIDYVYTVKADARFLDAVSLTRRGCILWWKPSHCCTFAGFVKDAQGRQFAAVIDNNHPEQFEFTPREQFVRLWSGYGGFALTPVFPPASSIPYKSYEVVR